MLQYATVACFFFLSEINASSDVLTDRDVRCVFHGLSKLRKDKNISYVHITLLTFVGAIASFRYCLHPAFVRKRLNSSEAIIAIEMLSSAASIIPSSLVDRAAIDPWQT